MNRKIFALFALTAGMHLAVHASENVNTTENRQFLKQQETLSQQLREKPDIQLQAWAEQQVRANPLQHSDNQFLDELVRKQQAAQKDKPQQGAVYFVSFSIPEEGLNPACTLASRQCAFYSDEGTCLHEYATYSCESKTSGKVMVCGGDVFCLDGECDKAQSGKSSDFGEAVSQLAALAAAGKDVAALNGVDVRAFTGEAKFCRKAAAGFSNCCKDGGWGQDVGLAKCNSEEKALGKAKDNKLTVSVGEFCSKKVLGVCLQKKRSYCQFDSKLAQIVQQQGRNGQLRIGFGSAKHPDCRGITVDELQKIQFDRLDFTNFYEDLMNNQKIPDSGVLTQKVKEQIADQLKQAGQ